MKTIKEQIASRKDKVIYVDNVAAKVSGGSYIYHDVVVDCVLNNKPLPEEFSDVFSLRIVEVNGEPRGILDFA